MFLKKKEQLVEMKYTRVIPRERLYLENDDI